MNIRDDIAGVLDDAVYAPSGDNVQPWRFRVTGTVIEVINRPDLDTSLYNFRQTSNHVALGALVENICIASRARGYLTSVQLLPDGPLRSDTVARVELTSGPSTAEPLAAVIRDRSSNRKPYELKRVPEIELQKLIGAAADHNSGCTVRFISEQSAIAKIATLVSVNEKVVLESKDIHAFLFSHVTWDPKDDEKRHGFYIDTFEFNSMQKKAFRLFRHWTLMRLANVFGMSDKIASETESTYRASAAFGAIAFDAPPQADSFLEAGRVLQRLWLQATADGLSMQMTVGCVFLARRVDAGDAGSLTTAHQDLLIETARSLERLFGAEKNAIAALFRIGYADPPGGRTTRFPPDIEWS